jgi:hypothetical protein
MVYSIVGNPFKLWVSDMSNARNDKVMDKGDHNIMILPEFKEIFDKSTHFSGMVLSYFYQPSLNFSNLYLCLTVQPGRTAFLLKPNAKRRATKIELEQKKKQVQSEKEAQE